MPSKRPIIGIACQFDPSPHVRDPQRINGTHRLPDDYVRAVRESGGTPMLLPTTTDASAIRDNADAIHGLLLTGGGDIAAHLFGEEPEPGLGPIDPLRDVFEMALCKEAFERDLPTLGVCKGIQVMNVVAGGTVIQDIASTVAKPIQHAQRAPGWFATHTLEIEPDSRFAEIVGTTRLRVNSFHHQSNGEAPEPFRVTASAVDGVVEVIESQTHRFAVGAQFHPEMMFDASAEMRALFRAFVDACRSQPRC